MGLCIASELFQQVLSSKLANLKNIKVAIDDILVFAKTEKEHDEALHALLSRLTEQGLTCKWEKCLFKKHEIEFFGMVISENGIRPKVNKIQDFIDATAPTDAKQLRSLLGLATYFSNRIQNLSQISEPLRNLLKKGATFDWNQSHQESFEKIKSNLITESLSHFDITRKTQVWVDAGPKGASAYIVQINNHDPNKKYLITCASRSFSKSELNYSQVEKEAFASLWACEHFHIYLFGCIFELVTDNRAVSIILDKDSDSRRRTPIRLQLWRSRLNQYNFTTKLVKSELNIADYLSRCFKPKQEVIKSKINRLYTQSML